MAQIGTANELGGDEETGEKEGLPADEYIQPESSDKKGKKHHTSILLVLSVPIVAVLLIASFTFWYAVSQEEKSINESTEHGEQAVDRCFAQYLTSIELVGQDFVKDISDTVFGHITRVVHESERKALVAASAVENTDYMSAMETNGFHGTVKLPMLGWMLLGPFYDDEEDLISMDLVVAGMNTTEEYNNWVWFGLATRNPNRVLACDFYYYRNATAKTSELWCLDHLYADPSQPSPSVFPHLRSPAIVRLQEAVPCEKLSNNASKENRSLLWMPLNFFVGTNNVFALTSVVTAVRSPTGECRGLTAVNVHFTRMAAYVTDLANSSRYDNLNIALIESGSETVLATSLGTAIYKINATTADGIMEEQQRAASLQNMKDSPLAVALAAHIVNKYGSVAAIPTPLIETTQLWNGEDYFISFDTFTRPDLNLTIVTLLPVLSITGETVLQRLTSQEALEVQQEELEDDMSRRLVIVIVVGTAGLLCCAMALFMTAGYITSSIQGFVKFMEKLRSQISSLHQKSRRSTTDELCEPLPNDFFPAFPDSRLTDLNNISAATDELKVQLLETWNAKQDGFKQALEQRQFTASIAHDIRNPLHGMLGVVSMMQSDFESHKEKLPLLADTCQHMAVLLNDMVDLSKIQGGKVSHEEKQFNCSDLLSEVVMLYKDKVACSGGSLSYQHPNNEKLPLACSDPVHVQRIVTNFVSNAAKYAAGSAIELKAAVVTREQVLSLDFLQDISSLEGTKNVWAQNADLDQDQYIVLACQDEGRGIHEAKLCKVFEAYQQTLAADRHLGAGLGLAIVKGLAIEMGGGLGVQSVVEKGSLFWLVVRCCPESSGSQEEKALAVPPVLTNSSGESSALPDQEHAILVVDDTKLNLMLVKHFLTRLSIPSVVTMSGPDALQKLRQDPQKFSLVLSDFHMPEMTGGELCLAIREDPALCHLPFVLSSGNHISEQEKDQYRIDEALMKPFSKEQLQETLKPLLGHPSKKWSSAAIPFPESAPTPTHHNETEESSPIHMDDNETEETLPDEFVAE